MQVELDKRRKVPERGWAYAGLLAALLLLPALHLTAVDFEDRSTSAETYLAHINARYLSIALAAGVGLLLTSLLIVHLAGLRRFAADMHPLGADAAVAVAGLAVLGLAVGFVSAGAAAYSAKEGLSYQVVETLGVLAESFAVWLLPALAGPAALVAVLGLRDRVLSRLLGRVAVIFAVALTLLGVLLPGVGALPALLWLVTMSAALSLPQPAGKVNEAFKQ